MFTPLLLPSPLFIYFLSVFQRIASPGRQCNLLLLGDNDELSCVLLQWRLQLTLCACVCVCSLQSGFSICPLSIFYSCTNKNAGAALVHVRAPLSSYFNCSHLIELSPWSVPSFLDVSISQINTRMGPECTAFRLRQQQSAFRNCLLVKCSTLLLFPADSVLSLCLPL